LEFADMQLIACGLIRRGGGAAGYKRSKSAMLQVSLADGFAIHSLNGQTLWCSHLQEQGTPSLFHVFLDIEAAYDCVNRNILWAQMAKSAHEHTTA
jgi:hypothetical protein